MPVIEVPGHGDVEFPDDMSDDEIVAAIQAEIGPPPLPKGPSTRARTRVARSPVTEGEKWKRAAGLAARDLSSGALFLPQMLSNGLSYGLNMGLSAADSIAELGGGNIDARLPYGSGEELANLLDLPEAITDDEKLSGKFGRLMGGVWGGSGLLRAAASKLPAQIPNVGGVSLQGTQAALRRLLEGMSSTTGRTWASAMGTLGIGAGEAVRRGGGDENAQLAAEVGTSLLTPGQNVLRSMAQRKGALGKVAAAAESTAAGSLAGAAVRGARRAAEQVGDATQRAIAAGRSLMANATNVDDSLRNLDAARDIIPGSRQTVAEASRDVGLNRFMNTIESGFDDKAVIAARRLDNDKARQRLLDRIGAREGLGESIRGRRDSLTTKLRDQAFENAGAADTLPIIEATDRIKQTPVGTKQSVSDAMTFVEKRIQELEEAFPGGVPAKHLYALRQDVADVLSGKLQGLRSLKGDIEVGADKFKAARSQLRDVLKVIDESIEGAAPGYRNYMRRYAQMSNAASAADLLNELKRGAQSNIASDFRDPGMPERLLTPSALGRQARQRADELDLRLPDYQQKQLQLIEEDILRSQGGSSAAVKGVGPDTARKLTETAKTGTIIADAAGLPQVMSTPLRMLSWLSDKRRAQYEASLAEAALDPKKGAAAIRAAQARDKADKVASMRGKKSRKEALDLAVQQLQSARAREGK